MDMYGQACVPVMFAEPQNAWIRLITTMNLCPCMVRCARRSVRRSELTGVRRRATQAERGRDGNRPDDRRALVGRRRPNDSLAALTKREREVLELVAEGRSNRGIASALFVTEGTVEAHIKQIFQKLRLDPGP